jgi:hypothetical protein
MGKIISNKMIKLFEIDRKKSEDIFPKVPAGYFVFVFSCEKNTMRWRRWFIH